MKLGRNISDRAVDRIRMGLGHILYTDLWKKVFTDVPSALYTGLSSILYSNIWTGMSRDLKKS